MDVWLRGWTFRFVAVAFCLADSIGVLHQKLYGVVQKISILGVMICIPKEAKALPPSFFHDAV